DYYCQVWDSTSYYALF
nr:immunoglobulin light chain junction region [Macaca mulatta]MOW06087.1 immunoglobulin light chain junction region [Macaca mulatta]MOW07784.1 immunoglobulin light chain junction region [Macaca mulatta]